MELWDALTAGAAAGRGELHCWVGDRYETTPWAQVSREAQEMTAGLRRAGVEPGARVASILTNTPLAVRGILGTWLAGGALASFPVPARGMSAEEYVDQLRTLVGHVEPAVMLLDEGMLGLLPEDLRERANARSWESVAGSGRIDLSPPEADELAFIQYSSGSTSMPKGCMLTPRAIDSQAKLVMEMLGAGRNTERNVSWLPLSHDMGLFGNLLTPWYADADLWLSPPERFMMSTRSWFADISDARATVTTGTNTALALAARTARRSSGDLSSLHTVILGAERLEWETLAGALRAFEPWGMRPEMLMPAYGLAEATLAVTATPRDEAPRVLCVDAVALADGQVVECEPGSASATHIVASGRPCQGVQLPGLEADRLTEIRIRSQCLAIGYYGDEGRTREHFRDGEFVTDDLGYARDGYLFPVGRSDDVISIGGRKVYAREIEAAVDALEGVRRGCSTIVETRDAGSQRLTLLVELKDGSGDFRELAEEAATLAMTKAAVALDECLFLAKGALPKTPSGKIQRYRCRHLLEGGRLEPVASVELAAV